MGVDITAHIILESTKSETNKYTYLGNFSANFLNDYGEIEFDWRDEPDDELKKALFDLAEEVRETSAFALLTPGILNEYIEEKEEEIKEIKVKRDSDYHIVHTSRSKAAVEDAMERITASKGSIDYRRENIDFIKYFRNGLNFIKNMRFPNVEEDFDVKKEVHCILEYW